MFSSLFASFAELSTHLGTRPQLSRQHLGARRTPAAPFGNFLGNWFGAPCWLFFPSFAWACEMLLEVADIRSRKHQLWSNLGRVVSQLIMLADSEDVERPRSRTHPVPKPLPPGGGPGSRVSGVTVADHAPREGHRAGVSPHRCRPCDGARIGFL